MLPHAYRKFQARQQLGTPAEPMRYASDAFSAMGDIMISRRFSPGRAYRGDDDIRCFGWIFITMGRFLLYFLFCVMM